MSWGGLEMNQLKNALWMRERGNEVFVFGIVRSRTEVFCTENNLDFISILTHRKYYDFSAATRLRSLLKEKEIEHVIIRHVNDMSVCALAKFWGKSRFKLHYFMEMQLGVKKRNLLHTLRFGQLDTWSCPLEWLKTQVETMTKVNKNKIVFIPTATDTEQFSKTMSKDEARKLLNIETEKLLLGIAGRFDPQKGQLLLLRALANHAKSDVEVLFLGETTYNEGNSYFDELQDFILKNNLSTRIYFRPFRKDIEVFYKAIDAFVMASKAESIGMVTIESMASGTPVIGSNAGGTVELLENGNNGFLFTSEDPKALGEIIDAFAKNSTCFSANQLQESVSAFNKIKVLPLIENRLMYTAKK